MGAMAQHRRSRIARRLDLAKRAIARLPRRLSPRRGRAVACVSVTATSALVAGLLAVVPAAADESGDEAWSPFSVSLVSVLPDGSGAFASTEVGVTASDDGRYVAFVGTGGGFTGQLFVRDRQAGATTLVSKDGVGAAAAAPIDAATISGDGNAIAFLTTASLLPSVPADGTEHVYLASWPDGTITAVPSPAAPSATVAAVPHAGIAISANGGKVAFVGMNSDDSAESLVVADMASGTATDIDTQETFEFPELSADGSVVAAIGGGDGGVDVYRTSGVFVGYFGDVYDPLATGGETDVAPYSLSADGNYVAFDTYVADSLHPVIFGVFQNSEVPIAADRHAGDVRLSADGSAVAYANESDGAIWLGNPPDSEAGQLPVTASDGSPTDGVSTVGELTENGTAVAFSSSATNLGGPTDGSQQVYYATSADAYAPSWSDGDALSVGTPSFFSADLSWPQAGDDVAVTAYQVFVDGKRYAVVDGYDTSFTVTGLSPGSTHSFAVRAVDFLGQQSADLSATGATAAVTRTQVIDSVSVLPDGRPSSTSGVNPSVSANGRYVAFTGSSSCHANPSSDNAVLLSQENLSCYQDNQALVRDRQSGTTTLLSHVVGEANVPPAGPYDATTDIAISADGSEVAFVSEGDNLVAGDADQTADLFVADRATALVHAVTVPDLGVPITKVAEGKGISIDADGTHVAFVGEESDNTQHLVVEDWRAGTATLIPAPAGTYNIGEPELSSDGSRLAFVAFLPDAETQVVVIDVADPSTPVLSRVIGDQYYDAYDYGTLEPRVSLSDDGQHLAYPRQDASGLSNLEVQDLSSLATAPAVIPTPATSICDATEAACYDAGAPALSADGGTLVFDPMTADGSHTLYKASPVDGAATPVAVLPDGTPDDNYPGDRTPAITADGTGVVFQSNNEDLAQLTTGSDVVYEHDPDAVAPSFAAGAAMAADNLTGTQARLSWPAATDDHVVIGYRVTQDGVTIADLDSTATNFTVTGLTAGGTYHFTVSGVDAALNVGAPLALDVTTPGGTQPPGEAPLAVDASAGGGHATLTWDPSSDPAVTGYRVLRGVGDTGPLTAIADVDGATSATFTDSGLAASTTYRYEVHTLGSNGEQNYTVTTNVTTPDLGAATISLNTPLVNGARAAKLGADVTVTVHGGADLAGAATVAYTKTDASSDTAQVELTETAGGSGTYTGKFPIAEGIVSIDGVTATLSDGAGHTASASAVSLPLPVSGLLRVTIDVPPTGSVDGAKLSVLSDSADTGAQTTVNGGQTVDVPLAAASDYTLTLTEPATYTAMPNYKVSQQSGLAVASGTTSTLTLRPTLPAFVSVKVSPTDRAQVDVYDADGNLIGTKTGAAAAEEDAFGPVPAGTQVRIDSTVLDESQWVVKHVSQTRTLAAGENQVTISHAGLPTATIAGTLTVSGAPPSWGGNVTATETVDGRAWTFKATPKADGTYSMTVLAGDVTLTADAYNAAPATKTVAVAAGATGNVDLDLEGPRQYQLNLGITTVEPDGTTATLPVDWRTAVHFRVSVAGPNYHASSSWLSPTVIVNGVPGDAYTICADGAEAGLPAACGTVTLGTEQSYDLAVTLTGAGRITGTLLGADGQPFTGHWNAYVYQLLNGQRRSIDYALGAGSALSIDVPSSGSYEVDVNGDGGVISQPVLANVAGGIVNVGQIPLGHNSAFSGAGNNVVAQSAQTTPGQVAEFRASYAYGGAATTGTLRLGIPAGTTLAPGSVTLGGQPVADPTVTDGYALLPLPSLPNGAAGVVHYAVATASGTPAGPLTSIVRMSYGASGNALIGSATTDVVGVTLAAPSQVKGLTAALTGHAPAGATVSVYDEFGRLVGAAVATEGGLWSTNVTLADRGESYHYTLQAAVTVGGVTVRSDTQRVTHDSHVVLPSALSLSQADGRVVNFDPASGVARFPYVFVPGYGLNVSACFPSGTTVSAMSARIGPQLGGNSGVGVLYAGASLAANDASPRSNGALINATRPQSVDSAALVGGSGSGNCYTAHLNPSTSQLGAVYLDYSATPAPFDASELAPPSGAIEQRMPPVFAGRTGDQVTDNGDGSKTFTTSLPTIDGSVSITGSTRTIDYTPTAADLASAAGAGVPVYGISQSVSGSDDSVNASLRVVIPQSWLQAYLPSGDTSAAGNVVRSNGLVRPADVVIPVEKAIEVTINMYGNGHSLLDSLGAGGPYDQLSKLLDDIDNSSCGDEGDKANLRNYLNNIAKDVRNQQILNGAMTVFGAVVGFGLGPIGSAVVGIAIDRLMDAAQDKMLRDAAKLVHDDLNSCENTTQVDEIADPDWVIDPSGFTYEAVTSNRLSGVTSTLLRASSPDGPFTVWDAAAYGQENPLTTDAEGKYGWNVPFGYWKVAYTKPGYETAYSQVFQIPPPRFDVNVGLTRIAAPTITLTRATSGAESGVTVGFDDYLKVSSVSGRMTVVDGDGNPVSGRVVPVDAQTAPDGTSLATTFRFTPDQPFTDGEALTVNVDELVRDYADHTLDAAFSAALMASAPTTPGMVNDVRAFAIDAHTVVVKWTTPADDGGSSLTGFHINAGGQSVDVAADASSATITGLSPMTSCTVAVAAANAVGAGPAQSVLVATPPLSTDEAFSSFHVPSTIDGGATGQGSVALPAPASSDTTVALSSDSGVASVPHGVTVPAGQSGATFDITTLNPVVDTDVTLTASNGGVSLDAPITVKHVDVALRASVSASGVALSWSAASDSDVTGYRVTRAVGDGSFTALADVDTGTTSYSDTTAVAGTTYRYQVLAVLPNDNAQPWSAVADANTPLRAVALSVITAPPTPVEGDDVTINVVATPADSGTAVAVAEGATTLGSGVVDADGKVAIVVHALAVGAHQLTVTYAGGATTAQATASATVTIAPAQHQAVATKLTVDPLRSLLDLLALAFGKYRVTAHLTRADNGAPIAGQRVVIDSWSGTFCTATTDAHGVASCPVPSRLAGVVLLGQVHASYAGSADYLPSEFGDKRGPGAGHGRR